MATIQDYVKLAKEKEEADRAAAIQAKRDEEQRMSEWAKKIMNQLFDESDYAVLEVFPETETATVLVEDVHRMQIGYQYHVLSFSVRLFNCPKCGCTIWTHWRPLSPHGIGSVFASPIKNNWAHPDINWGSHDDDDCMQWFILHDLMREDFPEFGGEQ